MRSWIAAALVLSVLPAGCRSLPARPRAVPECAGALVSTEDMGADFVWRASVLVSAKGRSWTFQLVAQKRGDELVLVGLHPLGAKLFTLRQRGVQTTVEALPPPVLEVPPENLLRDVHRIRFPHASGFPGANEPDGATPAPVFPPPVREGARIRVDDPACGARSEFVTLAEEVAP